MIFLPAARSRACDSIYLVVSTDDADDQLLLAQLTNEGGPVQGKKVRITLPEISPTGAGMASGAYVHVPFCFHKCHYCDFYSLVDGSGRQEAFTERLLREADAVADLRQGSLETLFVGGGTPTMLTPEQWQRLLPACRQRLGLVPGAEITVEANPETVTPELATVLAEGGVTRVSVGCQSFDPRHLRTLERWHDPEAVERSVERLRAAGITDLNLDLIFGTPGQTVADWKRDLDRAIGLAPTHVSCYALTYEPNTALTMRLRAGQVTPIDDDDELAMYELAIDLLEAAGYEHYEISAWARPGHRCRHNLLYWTNGSWWALGPSASGHLDGLRWKNVPRLGEYLEHGPWPPVTDIEQPDAERAAGEAFMMGLRLREGIPGPRVEQLLATPQGPRRREAIRRQVERGMLERADDALRLTRAGLLLGDAVVADLL